MDEYYDDGYGEDEDENEIFHFQKKLGEFKTNPKGPYKIQFKFKNIDWNITIQNINFNDFKVVARSSVKVNKSELEILKKYLKDEGFEQAARKHNLFW
jgi:hypothetical protein